MNSLAALILIISLVFIVLMWTIVGLRHLKHLRETVREQWENLDERIRKRHNLIPLLIEIVRRHFSDKEADIEELIVKRAMAVKEYNPGGKKIELEHDLTGVLNKILDLSGELAKDMIFLEVKKDFKEISEKIIYETGKYNEIVRRHNTHRRWIILRPLSWSFGLPVMNIFEVEI